jgi:uncharacterized membrane protein YciS (DUF1049 family)
MLGDGRGYSAVFLLCSAGAIVAMLIYGVMYVRVKRQVPELAPRASA